MVVSGNHVNKSSPKKSSKEASLIEAVFPTEYSGNVHTVDGTDYGSGFVEVGGRNVVCSHRPVSGSNPVEGNLNQVSGTGRDADISITACKHLPGLGHGNGTIAVTCPSLQQPYPYVNQIGQEPAVLGGMRLWLKNKSTEKGNFLFEFVPEKKIMKLIDKTR